MTTDLHALSGAYVLGAVDDRERAAFEEHLATCAACRADVASFEGIAPVLAATEDVAPPPGLRERVLAQARHTEQLPAQEPAATPEHPAELEEGDAGPTVVPLRRRRTRRVVAALAAAAVLAVGGGTVWQATRPDTPSVQTPVAQRVLEATDARRVDGPLTGGGRLAVVSSASVGETVVVGEQLPALEPGRQYQAWTQTPDGAVSPAGRLPDDGSPLVVQGGLSGRTGVAVSVEPEGGSAQPTTTPIGLVAV